MVAGLPREINMRSLVEFLLRHGDLLSGSKAGLRPERAQLGSQIHRQLQKEFAALKDDYRAEVSVHYEWDFGGESLSVTGRADGYWTEEILHLDEIKTVECPLSTLEEPEILHLAQAKGYAYLLARELGFSKAEVSVYYYQVETGERKRFSYYFGLGELESFFFSLLREWERWIGQDRKRRKQFFAELGTLQFPYPHYRAGQRDLAVAVYRTLQNGEKLFVQAPTGIGKTMSVLFPALMALREGCGERIFYLTARTAGLLAPQDALARLKVQMPHLLSMTLTAKDRLCPQEGRCDPTHCPRAKGHFDRVNQALFESLEEEVTFSRERILALAESYCLCPHEFALDLSLWADVIACDYNYVFDPQAKLKRFFGPGKKADSLFLVDEAHNLADRARDMYTARLEKKDFLAVQRWLKGREESPCRKLRKISHSLNRFFLQELSVLAEASTQVCEEVPDGLLPLLREFCAGVEALWGEDLSIGEEETLLELYFQISFFARLCEETSDGFCYYRQRKGSRNLMISLYCADPSSVLADLLSMGKGSVLFSGTLEPLPFFFRSMGGKRDVDRLFSIPSPFPPENKLVLAATDVATTYTKRERYYGVVADYIRGLASLPAGNYMVFFPSYQFLRAVETLLPEEWRERVIFPQPRTQDPALREAYLDGFVDRPTEVHLGLCVLGGVYAEGIDLVGDRLTGVMVVGVGLPMVCLEREIIRQVFDRTEEGEGYSYAYVYPGINKVLQAAGRVIRSMEDRGFILLLDERYGQSSYRNLLPGDWAIQYCRTQKDALGRIRAFCEEEKL